MRVCVGCVCVCVCVCWMGGQVVVGAIAAEQELLIDYGNRYWDSQEASAYQQVACAATRYCYTILRSSRVVSAHKGPMHRSKRIPGTFVYH